MLHQLDKEYLPYEDQEQCCNQHDICYDTCTVLDKLDQTQCDLEFKDCLHRICDNKEWWLTFVKCPLSYWTNRNYWNTKCEKAQRLKRHQSKDEPQINFYFDLFDFFNAKILNKRV